MAALVALLALVVKFVGTLITTIQYINSCDTCEADFHLPPLANQTLRMLLLKLNKFAPR